MRFNFISRSPKYIEKRTRNNLSLIKPITQIQRHIEIDRYYTATILYFRSLELSRKLPYLNLSTNRYSIRQKDISQWQFKRKHSSKI